MHIQLRRAGARRVAELAGPHAEWVEYPHGNHVCNNIACKYRPPIAEWVENPGAEAP